MTSDHSHRLTPFTDRIHIMGIQSSLNSRRMRTMCPVCIGYDISKEPCIEGGIVRYLTTRWHHQSGAAVTLVVVNTLQIVGNIKAKCIFYSAPPT